MRSIKNTCIVLRRELKSYFESPVAYVFMVAFLLLVGFLTFSISQLYERRVADLQPFFFWHPWVYLLLVPAATMGLWAEERRAGTVELLLTMPITMLQAIMGKFLAAWIFITFALLFTFPVAWWTGRLGDPDGGVILSGYIGSVLMAGGYVSVGMLMSSATRNQVIAFVLSLVTCLLLLLAGWPPVTDFISFVVTGFGEWIGFEEAFAEHAPKVVDVIAGLSFLTHFDSLQRGVVDLRDIAYYFSLIVFMIFATHVVLDNRKSA